MVEQTVTIINKLGLHARPAVMLVKRASQFKSDIKLLKDEMEIDGKSILGVLMLAAEKGSQIIIKVSGEDEEEALAELVKLFNSGFNEE